MAPAAGSEGKSGDPPDENDDEVESCEVYEAPRWEVRETRLVVGDVEVVEIVGRLDGNWSGARSEGGGEEDELGTGEAASFVPSGSPIGLAGRPIIVDDDAGGG